MQIAALTEKIRYMTEHLRTHHKDKASRLGLVAMLERRKKLLKYLRESPTATRTARSSIGWAQGPVVCGGQVQDVEEVRV